MAVKPMTVEMGPMVAKKMQHGMKRTGMATSSLILTAPPPEHHGRRQRSSIVEMSRISSFLGTALQVIHLKSMKMDQPQKKAISRKFSMKTEDSTR